MEVGDLVKHKIASSLGIGLITRVKEGSSGVFVRWLKTGTLQLLGAGRDAKHPDLMLEVINENN